MKKCVIIVLFIFFTTGSVWCGDFEDIEKSALRGNPEAQYKLGILYAKGEVIKQDYRKTLYWFTKSAEQGHSDAQLFLGLMYSLGRGISRDSKQAVYWYSRAAEQGNVSAQLFLGDMYCEGRGVTKDYSKAVFWYMKAANQENADAQYRLGNMYSMGKGVTIDYKTAILWLTKAAEQNHAGAQNSLGFMYESGYGVDRDYQKAIYWYTKSADQGNSDAQYNLGNQYNFGQGVNQNYGNAVYWYRKAAMQGHAIAQYNLGVLYYNGQGVPQNYQLSYAWVSLAATQDVEEAINFRNGLANIIPPYQLGQAQEIAIDLQHKIDKLAQSQDTENSITEKEKNLNISGTGFIITNDGYILTCFHVIENEDDVRIIYDGKGYPAKIVCTDPNNDIALLKVEGSFSAVALSLRRSANIGEKVFTIGYPSPSIQGVNPKYTSGTISSLTGIKDDIRMYQISVPVQPGNSGGPLVDSNGNVIGIIVSMLDAKTIFNITGSLPQNVNYAVKSIYAHALLDTLPGISNKLVAPAKHKTDAVEKVINSTVVVLCYSP